MDINKEINKAIQYSMDYHCKVFIYSNGNSINWGDVVFKRENDELIGIYENGTKLIYYTIWFVGSNKELLFSDYFECLEEIKKYEKLGYEHIDTYEIESGYRFVLTI